MSKVKRPLSPVQFFYKWAGSSYNPATETKEQGRWRGARALASAEQWLTEQEGHTVEWIVDESYNPKDYDVPDMPPIGWGCVVKVGDQTQSLWAITFGGDHYPAGDPYARVVVAELASELMPR